MAAADLDHGEPAHGPTARCRPRSSTKAAQLAALEAELEETNRGVVALYAELDTQAEQLRQATDLKSRFLSYMSHEFRTPIASIRSLTRLLLDRVDGPLTEEQERQVRFIESTVDGIRARWSTTCSTSPRSRPAGSRSRRPGSRWSTCSPRCAACSSRCSTNPDVSLVFEEPRAACPALHRRQEAVADPAQLHLERAEVHAARARCASRRSRTARRRSLSRSATPASASQRSTTTRSSTTSRRSIRRSRSGCAAPGSGCR